MGTEMLLDLTPDQWGELADLCIAAVLAFAIVCALGAMGGGE